MVSLLAVVLAAAQAQTTYLETSFDDGIPASFALYDEDQRTPATEMQRLGFEVGVPWIVLTEAGTDNRVAASTSYYKNSGRANDWMVLPPLTIGSDKAVLRWRSRAQASDFRDGLQIYISAAGPAPADFDTTQPLFSVAREQYQWAAHEVSLADYAGQTVWIAFVNQSNDQMCLYVDDIFVGVPSAVALTLDFGRVANAYGRVPVSGTVQAATAEPLAGYTIGFSCGGQTFSQSFADTLRRADGPRPFVLADSIALGLLESADYAVWATAGGDSTVVAGRLTAMPRRHVVEEFTGTWCAWCVRGTGAMAYLRQSYPQHFVGIALHNHSKASHPDSMAIAGEKYRSWTMQRFNLSGFPSCVVDRRSDYAIDPMQLPAAFAYLQQSNDYHLGISLDAVFDPSTGQIGSTTRLLSTQAENGQGLRLFYVVIENDVHRTYAETGHSGEQSGYDQLNAYAGGSASAESYGFELLPSNIPADSMWYQEVARATVPADNFTGLGGVFPTDIEPEQIYAYEHQIALPANVQKAENVRLVVMLLDENGTVLNADEAPLRTVAEPDGVESLPAAHRAMTADDGYVTMGGQRTTTPRRGVYVHRGRKIIF